MNVTPFLALVIVFSLLELLILGGVLFFYLRLRRSETLLNSLHGNQESLLARIEMNARMEREMRADSDLWLLEIEERDGKHFLGDDLMP